MSYHESMHVVIFEGIRWNTFAPLSLSRPVFALATGMASLLEKQVRHTNPSRLTLWVRPEMAEFCRRRIVPKLTVPTQVNVPLDDEPALLFSGRTLHFRQFVVPEQPAAVIDEGDIVRAARVQMPGLSPEDVLRRSERWMSITKLPRMESQTRMVEHLWDLISWNEESLIEDFAHLNRAGRPKPPGAYHMIDEENIWLGEQVRVQPGVVLDASRGPIIVDQHAVLCANAVLQGPCYIGPYATINPLANIRPGTSIGTMCKIGGEVSNSIFFGYTNKAHEGFLGHSYVGKWVNLGAGTTTSNLKNTYGLISVAMPGGDISTGQRFLGAMIGDHAKTAIGTRLMAGAYVGFSSMLATSGFAPRFVPSFSFQTDRGREPYRLDKAVDVMKIVFARRNRMWDEVDETVIRYVAEAAGEMEGAAVTKPALGMTKSEARSPNQ